MVQTTNFLSALILRSRARQVAADNVGVTSKWFFLRLNFFSSQSRHQQSNHEEYEFSTDEEAEFEYADDELEV